jgi:hypothetical protein
MQRRSLLPSAFSGFPPPSLRQGGDPFLALHREMNRLFDEALRGFGPPEGGAGSQGRRMKSSNQKRQHVLIIPGGLLASSPDADSRCSVATYEVDGDLAQDG